MKKKLKEICNIEKGKQIDTKLLDDSNSYRYINGGIKESGFYNDFNTSGEAVLISEGGASCGYVNYVNERFWCGCHCYRLTDINAYPKFLFYSLKASQNGIMELRTGAAMPNIKKESLKNFEVSIIEDKEEQQKIAAHLDTIQSAIDNKKQQLSLLDEAVKSKFVEMFGENPVESGKWQIENLGSMCSISGGYAFKSGDFKENGIPILRIGNINAGFFRPVNMVYWNENTNLEKYAVYPGDLVMSLTGTAGKEDYGNICILDNEYPKYYLNQRNAMFTKLKDLNKFYLAFLLKLPNMKSRLTGLNHGVRQGNILNKDLETLPIPIPPLDLQNQFASFVQQIDKSKSLVKQQIADLQELLDSKMQEYFS